MVRAIFLQALGDYLRFRRIFPWLLLAVASFGLTFLFSYLMPTDTLGGRYSTISDIMVFKVLALASAIYTTAIIGGEVEQRTIVYLLTRPVPRWMLLLVRYVASVLVVSLLTIIVAVATSLGVYHSAVFSNPMLSHDIVAIVIGAMAYGALFLFISLLFNRAMIICLLFAFGWETSVPNMPGEVFYLSINSHVQGIAAHLAGAENKGLALLAGTAGDNIIAPSVAWFSLIGVVIVCLAAASWWFTNFEYVPREDAE